MAKGSKAGACSAHVDPAKANCLQHDRREGKIPSYVNPHLTHTNRVVFEDVMIRDRKHITPLVNQAKKLFTEKTGQKCQAKFVPFREDVLKLKPGITDTQLMDFKAQVEKETGWKVIGIYLHQDEGHVHSKYIEGDEDFAINYHAHVLYSCQDQETGKAIRLPRKYFRLRQDWLAAATGMERGNPASETGINHRTSMQQRIFAQEQRIAQLEERLSSLRQEIASMDVSKASKERLLGFLGMSTKDKEINSQRAEIDNLRQQLNNLQHETQQLRAAKATAEAELANLKKKHDKQLDDLVRHHEAELKDANQWKVSANNMYQTIQRQQKEIGELKRLLQDPDENQKLSRTR